MMPTPQRPPAVPRRRARVLLERTLPPEVLDSMPEAKVYAKMLATERLLDSLISRKRFDISDMMRTPPKKRCVLRVQVSNRCENQVPIAAAHHGYDPTTNSSAEALKMGSYTPSWVLRIAGEILNISSQKAPKFSNIIRQMKVEIYPEGFKNEKICLAQAAKLSGPCFAEYVAPQPLPSGKILPPRHPQSTHFEIQRAGDTDLDVLIRLKLDYGPHHFKLSPNLADVIGFTHGYPQATGISQLHTKKQVVLALWEYIRRYNLVDPEDRRLVVCDSLLSSLFGVDRVLFPQLPDLINKFLLPPDDVVIPYHISVGDGILGTPVVNDIEIDIDDFEAQSQLHEAIQKMMDLARPLFISDDLITSKVFDINTSYLKQCFYSELVEDPQGFIASFVASQSRDLEVMLSLMRCNREEMRTSKLFSEPWAEDALRQYLCSKYNTQ